MKVFGSELDEILNNIKDGGVALVLSKNKSYDKIRSVLRFESEKDLKKIVGREISCIVVDSSSKINLSLNTLEFIFTRIRGDNCKEFEDKIYFLKHF